MSKKISIEEIKKIAKSENIFENGVKLFKAKGVIDFGTMFDEEDLICYYGDVHSKSNVYSVEVNFKNSADGKDIIFSSGNCNCPYPGNCKHIVAVLLELESRLRNGGESPLESSVPIKMIKEAFLGKIISESKEPMYELIPIFDVYRNSVVLKFKISAIGDKSYIVKNVYELLGDFQRKGIVEYSNKLTVLNNEELFSNRKFLMRVLEIIERNEILIESMSSKNISRGWYGYNGASTLKYEKKFLAISIKEFLELMEINQSLRTSIFLMNGNTNYIFQETEEKLVLKVDKYSDDEYEVYIEGLRDKSVKKVLDLLDGYGYFKNSVLYYRKFKRDIPGNIFELLENDNLKFGISEAYNFQNIVLRELEEDFIILSSIDLEAIDDVQDIDVKIDCDDLGVVVKIDCGDVRMYNSIDEKKSLLLKSTLRKYQYKIESEDEYFINEPVEIFNFIKGDLKKIYEYADNVWISEEFKKIRVIDDFKLTVKAGITKQGLDLRLLSTDFTESEVQGIIEAHSNGDTYYKLNNSSYIALDKDELREIENLLGGLRISSKDLSKGAVVVDKFYSLYLDTELRKSKIFYRRDEELRRISDDFSDLKNSDFELPNNLTGTLRDYQIDGFKWLKLLRNYGLGGILGDDMGLGKTFQVLALLASFKSDKPHIVISPASLVLNWKKEVEKFTPHLKVLIYDGVKRDRIGLIKDFPNYSIILTSYDILKRDISEIVDQEFDYAILDEGQNIKNYNTKSAIGVKALKSQNRLVLTGTPIENTLAELWSIFDFLMPNYLYAKSEFAKIFEYPIVKNGDRIALSKLKGMVEPFLLRRLKRDVLKDLPEKREQILFAKMDQDQRKVYDAYVFKLKKYLSLQSGEQVNRNKLEILAELMKLRQICCNPLLINDEYKGGSCKEDITMELLNELVEGSHKTIIFSQFTANFVHLKKAMDKENIAYYEFTGKTKKNIRHQLVDNFNTDDTPVFLISLKAGGTGLNITGADTVIHFDPWWNLSVESQGTDRVHRIGQTKEVNVYKLICENTIEEKVLEIQMGKKKLADSILINNSSNLKSMKKEDILGLFS